MHHIYFIYSSDSGQLGLFSFLSVVNRAVMNRRVQMSLQDATIISFGWIPSNGVATSVLL